MSDRDPGLTRTREAKLSPEKILQIIPIAAIGATTAFFSIGLLIVNINLMRFGLYSRQFLRTEYILAGAAFVVLLTVTDLTVTFLFREWSSAIGDFKQGKYKSGLLVLVLSTITPLPVFMLLQFMSGGRLAFDGKEMWAAIGALAFCGLIIHATMNNLSFLWAERLAAKKSPYMRDFKTHEILVQVALLIIFLSGYATIAYPLISPTFGGGYREQVLLIPTAEGKSLCKQLALPFQSDAAAVGPVKLLSESESEVVIIPQSKDKMYSHAIKLNRNLFYAIANIPDVS